MYVFRIFVYVFYCIANKPQLSMHAPALNFLIVFIIFFFLIFLFLFVDILYKYSPLLTASDSCRCLVHFETYETIFIHKIFLKNTIVYQSPLFIVWLIHIFYFLK